MLSNNVRAVVQYGSIILTGFKFAELHTLTLAARFSALLCVCMYSGTDLVFIPLVSDFPSLDWLLDPLFLEP